MKPETEFEGKKNGGLMKARWLTLFASVPLIVGTVLLQSCGGVGGPSNPATSPGSSTPSQNFLALMTAEQKASKYIGPEACSAATCHGGAPSAHVSTQLASFKPATAGTNHYTTWKNTVHATKGVTCESCHGPGSAHQAAPKNADGSVHAMLTFPKIASTEVCGQCHGPIHDQWSASKHSELITSPITSTVSSPAGSGQSSRCFLCHGGLTRAQYMENGTDPSQMTTTQIVQVANDILNVVPSTALCSTCHNPHSKTGNLTKNGEDEQLYHAVASLDSTPIAPGTTAAQFTAPNQICGQCHNGRATNGTDAFLTSNTSRPSAHHSNQFNTLLGVGGSEGLGGPPQRMGTHAQTPGQCTTCHMPSSRHTMTVSYDQGCAPCHTANDAANRASTLKTEVVNSLTALSNRMAVWAQTKFGDPTFWDYTSNIASGKTAPAQSLIPIEVKRARHNYYYLVISNDYGIHNPIYARYLLKIAADNLTTAGIPSVKPIEVAQIPMNVKLQQIKEARTRGVNNPTD